MGVWEGEKGEKRNGGEVRGGKAGEGEKGRAPKGWFTPNMKNTLPMEQTVCPP